MRKYFPGAYEAVMKEHNIPLLNTSTQTQVFIGGQWQARRDQPGPMNIYLATRGFVEAATRKCMAKYTNVQFQEQTTVINLVGSGDRVTGVLTRTKAGSEVELSADLLVDCSGKGGNTCSWLKQFGVEAVPEWSVQHGISYTTMLFKRDNDDIPIESQDGRSVAHRTRVLAVYPDDATPPKYSRHGLFWPVEHDQYQCSLIGVGKDPAPTDYEGFVRFSETLAHPAMANLLKGLKPIGPGTMYMVPTSRFRLFHKLDDVLPNSFLCLGDSVMNVDPVFGQGKIR